MSRLGKVADHCATAPFLRNNRNEGSACAIQVEVDVGFLARIGIPRTPARISDSFCDRRIATLSFLSRNTEERSGQIGDGFASASPGTIDRRTIVATMPAIEVMLAHAHHVHGSDLSQHGFVGKATVCCATDLTKLTIGFGDENVPFAANVTFSQECASSIFIIAVLASGEPEPQTLGAADRNTDDVALDSPPSLKSPPLSILEKARVWEDGVRSWGRIVGLSPSTCEIRCKRCDRVGVDCSLRGGGKDELDEDVGVACSCNVDVAVTPDFETWLVEIGAACEGEGSFCSDGGEEGSNSGSVAPDGRELGISEIVRERFSESGLSDDVLIDWSSSSSDCIALVSSDERICPCETSSFN